MRTKFLVAATQLWLVHLLLVVGLFPELPLSERWGLYPAVLGGVVRPEVLAWVWPELLLTGTQLLGGLLLAWGLAAWMGRWSRQLLWVSEGIPPYLVLMLLVWGGLTFTLWRGQNFPLIPWHPVMLGILMVSLAWAAAARAALASRQVRGEALRADFTRTARAMGLPERTVYRQAARVALPQRAWSLAGEAMGLTLSLIIMEGLLDFPGLGREVNLGLQSVLSGRTVESSVSAAFTEALLPVQIIGVSLFLLLALTLGAALILAALAGRLDPRPRLGGEGA